MVGRQRVHLYVKHNVKCASCPVSAKAELHTLRWTWTSELTQPAAKHEAIERLRICRIISRDRNRSPLHCTICAQPRWRHLSWLELARSASLRHLLQTSATTPAPTSTRPTLAVRWGGSIQRAAPAPGSNGHVAAPTAHGHVGVLMGPTCGLPPPPRGSWRPRPRPQFCRPRGRRSACPRAAPWG